MFYFKAALSVVFTASEQRYKKRKSYFSENSLAYLKNSFHFCREIKSSPILNPSPKGKDFLTFGCNKGLPNDGSVLKPPPSGEV